MRIDFHLYPDGLIEKDDYFERERLRANLIELRSRNEPGSAERIAKLRQRIDELTKRLPPGMR